MQGGSRPQVPQGGSATGAPGQIHSQTSIGL